MEVAKISSKGQITIPVSVRNALKLKAGDKIVILEENGRFYFENSAMLAFKRAGRSIRRGGGEGGLYDRGRNAGLHEGNPKGSKGVLVCG